MSKKPINVTLYYRVSTKAEAQESSFKNQPKYFKLLLNLPEYKNYKAVKNVYCDFGLSGTKLNRPGFKRMLENAGLDVEMQDKSDIPHPLYPNKLMKQRVYITSVNPKKNPEFEEIWIKSTSRFARNINAYDIICTLRLAQVYVFFIDQNLTSRNPDHMPLIRKRLDEDMAYSEQLSRTRQITQIQYEEENRLLGCPFGYEYHKKTKTKLPYATIHPTDGPIVEKMYQLALKFGCKGISDELLKEGIINSKTGKPFSPSAIRNILHNEKYKGLNNLGKYTTGPLFEKLPSAIIREDYKDRLQETEHLPQLISVELWEDVQEKMKDRYTTPNPKTGLTTGLRPPSHPFRNLLVCGSCENHFVYDNNNGHGFFKCSTKATKGASVCNCNNLFVYQLDAFLDNLMNGGLHAAIKTDYENTIISLITLCEGYLTRLKNPSALDNTELQELGSKLKSKVAGRSKLLDLLSSGEYDFEQEKDFDTRIKDIDLEIKGLKFDISQLETSTSNIVEKLNDLFNCIFSEFKIVEQKKEKYNREEILELLSQVQVYGKTEHALGGKKPDVTLIPILKLTEQAQGLILTGFSEFTYKFRNSLPQDYKSPENFIEKIKHKKVIKQEPSPLHPFDDPDPYGV